ncbi:MAG: acylphosphatase [Candidatus Schekmanbacteria bacterium]|nr:MAG: acylphosphatase [Candidatus Schekmanbacteria bacterium]
MKKAAKFIVKGTVQGVFFRQFVKSHADNLGLFGYVRNLENGDVEIVVEGSLEKIERFEKLIREGPKHAQIREVLREDRKWMNEFSDFRILRF